MIGLNPPIVSVDRGTTKTQPVRASLRPATSRSSKQMGHDWTFEPKSSGTDFSEAKSLAQPVYARMLMSDFPQVSRRTFLQVSAPAAAATTLVLQETVKPQTAEAGTLGIGKPRTGARLLVQSLQAHQVCVIFGIPGAQENELWDEFKQQGLDYVLVTHEQSAAMMADGYARASGKPGVIAIVPGPGITNALTGIGEAKLDSIPMVCIVGDIAKGKKYHPFQVHELPTVDLLRPVTKCVIEACQPDQISNAIQQAFCTAQSGEPGPVAVVIPYPVLVEQTMAPIAAPIGYQVSCDEPAIQRAIACLAKQQKQVVSTLALAA